MFVFLKKKSDDPACCGRGMSALAWMVFQRTGLLELCGIDHEKLWNFLKYVQNGYLKNPYHNKYHAADVLITVHFWMQTTFFKKHINVWDQFSCYIAAIVHDLHHNGRNNMWHSLYFFCFFSFPPPPFFLFCFVTRKMFLKCHIKHTL